MLLKKQRSKPMLMILHARVDKLEKDVAKADDEIDRAFAEYGKLLELKPEDRSLLNEIASNYYTFKRYDGAAKTWAKLIDPCQRRR